MSIVPYHTRGREIVLYVPFSKLDLLSCNALPCSIC